MAPPARYLLPFDQAISRYEKADSLCRKAISSHPSAPDLWMVRNRRIAALLALWKLKGNITIFPPPPRAKLMINADHPKGCQRNRPFLLGKKVYPRRDHGSERLDSSLCASGLEKSIRSRTCGGGPPFPGRRGAKTSRGIPPGILGRLCGAPDHVDHDGFFIGPLPPLLVVSPPPLSQVGPMAGARDIFLPSENPRTQAGPSGSSLRTWMANGFAFQNRARTSGRSFPLPLAPSKVIIWPVMESSSKKDRSTA